MKLAEALLERADLQKRIEQLQARIVANASFQEGEEPTENASDLLADCLRSIDDLEKLVAEINLTNSSTTSADGRTVTALLAARESLRARHSILVRAADAATGAWARRQTRTELRQISALPVKGLREQAESVAKQLRDLDVLIQRTNWEADVIQN